MNDDLFAELTCPNCAHTIKLHGQDAQLSCPACGSQLHLQSHVCFACGKYHPQETSQCPTCGTAIDHNCEICQESVWAGAEFCQHCGAPLDIFKVANLAQPYATITQPGKPEGGIQYLKNQDRPASEKRLASLMLAEQKRLYQLHVRQMTQRQQDKQLLATAVVVLSIFVLIIATFAVL